MVVCKLVIHNVYDYINKPVRIWHSYDGKILTVELQYGKPVIYYETNPRGDQEFFSYIVAVETEKEIPSVTVQEPKYLRTLMFDNNTHVLHFYTIT